MFPYLLKISSAFNSIFSSSDSFVEYSRPTSDHSPGLVSLDIPKVYLDPIDPPNPQPAPDPLKASDWFSKDKFKLNN